MAKLEKKAKIYGIHFFPKMKMWSNESQNKQKKGILIKSRKLIQGKQSLIA